MARKAFGRPSPGRRPRRPARAREPGARVRPFERLDLELDESGRACAARRAPPRCPRSRRRPRARSRARARPARRVRSTAAGSSGRPRRTPTRSSASSGGGVPGPPGISSSSRSPSPGSLSCQSPRRSCTRRRKVIPARASARSAVSWYVEVKVFGSSGSPGISGSANPGEPRASARARASRGASPLSDRSPDEVWLAVGVSAQRCGQRAVAGPSSLTADSSDVCTVLDDGWRLVYGPRNGGLSMGKDSQ